MQKAITRLIYMDDSGEPKSGLEVLAWIEFEPSRWNAILSAWMDLRRKITAEFRVSSETELHASHFVHGRGRLTKNIPEKYTNNGIELWKDFGRDLAKVCLEGLRSTEGLEVHALYLYGIPGRRNETRKTLYGGFVHSLETRLKLKETLALVFVDGDGSDLLYRNVHRELKLKDRSIVEDAIHLESSNSQLIQIADLIAWCATTSIEKAKNNHFGWDWYSEYLSERDQNRKPQELKQRDP